MLAYFYKKSCKIIGNFSLNSSIYTQDIVFSRIFPPEKSADCDDTVYFLGKVPQISHSFAEIIKALADIIKSHRFA